MSSSYVTAGLYLEGLCWNVLTNGIDPCLGHCSLAVKRHCDQGNFGMKAVSEGLAYSFSGLVHNHHGGVCGNRQAGMAHSSSSRESLYPDAQATGRGGKRAFEISKPTSSDVRPNLLILSK